MKRFLVIFILIATFAIILTLPQLKSEVIKILSVSQCDTPTAYKLGALDPKFGLSSSSATNDIASATDIWSKAYGKPLFTYSSSATLTVNFVYDERSALNVRIDQLQNQLGKNDTTLEKQIGS